MGSLSLTPPHARTPTPRTSASSVPYGKSYMDNTRRLQALRDRRRVAATLLTVNTDRALKYCVRDDPLTHPANATCTVIWDTIEELCATLSDIDEEIDRYWECWDDVECREYDI